MQLVDMKCFTYFVLIVLLFWQKNPKKPPSTIQHHKSEGVITDEQANLNK